MVEDITACITRHPGDVTENGIAAFDDAVIMERRNGPRRLRVNDDDDDFVYCLTVITLIY